MDGMTITQILAMLKPLSLPVLLYVGKWLKGRSWFMNGAIPYAILGLNGASWVLLSMGLVHRGTDGGLVAPTPDALGFAAVGVPGLALMAWAIPGIGTIVGTALSIGVEQFIVNRAHKGIKYRALFKIAEASGMLPAVQARELRSRSNW